MTHDPYFLAFTFPDDVTVAIPVSDDLKVTFDDEKVLRLPFTFFCIFTFSVPFFPFTRRRELDMESFLTLSVTAKSVPFIFIVTFAVPGRVQ